VARFGRSFPIRPHLPKLLASSAAVDVTVSALPLVRLRVAAVATVAGGAATTALPLVRLRALQTATVTGGATVAALPLVRLRVTQVATVAGGASVTALPLVRLRVTQAADAAGGAAATALPLVRLRVPGLATVTGGASADALPLVRLRVASVATVTGGAAVTALPLVRLRVASVATAAGGATVGALPLVRLRIPGLATATEISNAVSVTVLARPLVRLRIVPGEIIAMAPTLSWVDSHDGTGGVATLSGTTAGATNTLRALRADCSNLLWDTWHAVGSRSGDGTITVTSLDPGDYWLAYDADFRSSFPVSNFVYGHVTNSNVSPTVAQTPLTSTIPYMSVAEFAKRVDIRTIADLIGDQGARIGLQDDGTIDVATVAANANLAAILLDASGEVEAAGMKGARYTPSDLMLIATTTGAAQGRLFRIVTRLAVGMLYERRPDKGPPPAAYDQALEQLQQLRDGVMIFGTLETSGAQVMEAKKETRDDVDARNLSSVQASRYFGRRGNRE
jgi:hypothetical protein